MEFKLGRTFKIEITNHKTHETTLSDEIMIEQHWDIYNVINTVISQRFNQNCPFKYLKDNQKGWCNLYIGKKEHSNYIYSFYAKLKIIIFDYENKSLNFLEILNNEKY